MAFPGVHTSWVGVDEAIGVDVLVGMDEAIGAGVSVGSDETIGVSVGLKPGMYATPSLTLYPLADTLSVSPLDISLILGPKAIQTETPISVARIAVRAYSTSPCPLSYFLVEYFRFIFHLLKTLTKWIMGASPVCSGEILSEELV